MTTNHYDVSNIYSPSGHMLQVEYAQVAVRKGSTIAGLCTKRCVVLGVEKKAIEPLQIERTTRRIKRVDKNIAVAFAGLTADARILVDRAQGEAQSYRLNFDQQAPVEHISMYLAKMQHEHTQSSVVRPFGVSCLIGGFDEDGASHLFETDPSGVYREWKANATGLTSQTVNEYFLKNYARITGSLDVASAVHQVIRALLMSSVNANSQYEMVVLKNNVPMEIFSPEKMNKMVISVKQEIANRAKRRRFRI